ncbi:hypothetical protein HN873_052497, partial [Arachis hypogaea]
RGFGGVGMAGECGDKGMHGYGCGEICLCYEGTAARGEISTVSARGCSGIDMAGEGVAAARGLDEDEGSSSASLALSHLSALPPSYPLTRLCWRSHSLGAHYSPRRSANGDRLSYLRAASLCPPSSIVSSHLLYRLLSQRERWKFRFSERGPSPEHSGEAPGSLVRFRCLRQQIMDLCLQSNPYSSKALFCPFSQSFTFRYTETLDQKSDIVVPEDDHGLYAIDILDPSLFTKCIHLTEVYHFHDMIDMLVGCGYKKGTTLLGYGYDFSQSNRIDKLMDGLKAKLETAYKASGGRKVNLISHSMGGIMILCFLPLHRDDFVKYVNK